MDSLINYDQQLFLTLNGFNSPNADAVMSWITNKYSWIPLYLFLIFLIVKDRRKDSLWILATVIAAVGLADFVSSGIMKPLFVRPRPCHDPLIGHLVHMISGCGGQYGFSSSHASTSFALATSLYIMMHSRFKIVSLLFIWALIYSYSRIYVGVHYPGDIIAGAIVGMLSGVLCTRLHSFILKKPDIVH